MFAILPFVAGVLLVFIFQTKHKDWRDSILCAAVIWGVVITFLTEILNFFHKIDFTSLLSIWFILNGVLVFIFIKLEKHKTLILPNLIAFQQLEIFKRLILISIAIIVFIIGLVAMTSPPNNWDSMAYVMPRIEHWIQNHSINHYPTHYTPQLYNGPWAEFALMHLQILSDSDRLANVLQFLSMIGCLVGVSLIAKLLGANGREQIFSMLVCATIPVGILQASNSKNTYVIAFWLVCLVYYSVLMIKNQPTRNLVLLASTSLSLAVLTKGTAYIYALPFISWLVVSTIRKLRAKIFSYLVSASMILLLINLGHYLRNLWIFGSPISTYPYKWSNEIYSLKAFISNLVKNISLHLIPPFFDRESFDQLIIKFHQFLGVNPGDPKLSLNLDYEILNVFNTQGLEPTFEDTAGNSFHFWIVIIIIILLFKQNILRRNQHLVIYLLATVSSFLGFCLLLKWQIWHSRLHLPFFVLMCPVVGIVLERSVNRRISQYFLVLLLLTAFPYLLLNETRPIATENNIFNTDRITQYFSARDDLKSNYVSLANLIKQSSCYEIGLIQRPDAWEYPLWMLLKQSNQRSIRLEHVNVRNPSELIAQNPYYRNFQPCMIVSIGLPPVQRIVVHNQTYSVYDADKWEKNMNVLEPIQVFFKP